MKRLTYVDYQPCPDTFHLCLVCPSVFNGCRSLHAHVLKYVFHALSLPACHPYVLLSSFLLCFMSVLLCLSLILDKFRVILMTHREIYAYAYIKVLV